MHENITVVSKYAINCAVPAVNAADLPHLGLMGGVKEALWIEVPHADISHSLHSRKLVTLEGSDYAEVDTQNLSSFYNSRREAFCNPTPYATTILVPNNRQDSCSVSILLFVLCCLAHMRI